MWILVDSPMVIPSGSDFGHPVFTIGVIRFSSFCVSESTTPNGINSYEKHKHGDSENWELVPIPSYVFKHTSFARITLIAEQIGGIVPPVAIRVLCHHRCCRVVSASSWWLTTSRLHNPKYNYDLAMIHLKRKKGFFGYFVELKINACNQVRGLACKIHHKEGKEKSSLVFYILKSISNIAHSSVLF